MKSHWNPQINPWLSSTTNGMNNPSKTRGFPALRDALCPGRQVPILSSSSHCVSIICIVFVYIYIIYIYSADIDIVIHYIHIANKMQNLRPKSRILQKVHGHDLPKTFCRENSAEFLCWKGTIKKHVPADFPTCSHGDCQVRPKSMGGSKFLVQTARSDCHKLGGKSPFSDIS